jgi:hypothetical protein
MAKRNITIRVRHLHDPDHDPELAAMTPEERIELMWRLAVDAWAFKGEPVGESRLPRHVVRVIRGGS